MFVQYFKQCLCKIGGFLMGASFAGSVFKFPISNLGLKMAVSAYCAMDNKGLCF